jgi:hypothetical protein
MIIRCDVVCGDLYANVFSASLEQVAAVVDGVFFLLKYSAAVVW